MSATKSSGKKPGSEVSTASAAGPQGLVTDPQEPATDPKAGAIYIWEEPEIPLLGFFTAQQVTISLFQRDATGITVEGTITSCDYTEGGMPFTEEWIATPNPGNPAQIAIRPKISMFTEPGVNYPLFTTSLPHHNKVVQFLGQQISFFARAQRLRPTPYSAENPLKILTPRFEGAITPYTGPCLCSEVAQANRDQLFDLVAAMGHVSHPKNCFKCSCGRMWWSPPEDENPEGVWAELGDLAAWDMLVLYDGMAHRLIDCDPTPGQRPTLYLLKTLRDRGFIPLC